MSAKTFATELLAEIDSFDPEVFPPKEAIKKNEKLLHAIDDPWLRRLHSITTHYRREAARIGLEAKLDAGERGVDEKEDEGFKEFSRLAAKHQFYAELFWTCIKDRYQTYSLNIGIRKDWQLVQRPEDEPEIPGQIRKIFGIGLE